MCVLNWRNLNIVRVPTYRSITCCQDTIFDLHRCKGYIIFFGRYKTSYLPLYDKKEWPIFSKGWLFWHETLNSSTFYDKNLRIYVWKRCVRLDTWGVTYFALLSSICYFININFDKYGFYYFLCFLWLTFDMIETKYSICDRTSNLTNDDLSNKDNFFLQHIVIITCIYIHVGYHHTSGNNLWFRCTDTPLITTPIY